MFHDRSQLRTGFSMGTNIDSKIVVGILEAKYYPKHIWSTNIADEHLQKVMEMRKRKTRK